MHGERLGHLRPHLLPGIEGGARVLLDQREVPAQPPPIPRRQPIQIMAEGPDGAGAGRGEPEQETAKG